MQLRQSEDHDLETLTTWLDNELDARCWGGPMIRFPLLIPNLKSQIQWTVNRSYSLVENDSLLGFAQIAPKFHCNHICRVLINPGMRRKGLGKHLMNLVFESSQSDHRNYSLFVYEENAAAIQLYKALGFQIQPQPEGVDNMNQALFMMKQTPESGNVESGNVESRLTGQ